MFSIQPEQISKYIVETSNEGVWIIDGEMQTQFVNQRMAEMLGSTPEEMKDANLLDFIYEADKTEIFQKIKWRKRGIKEEFDFCYRRRDGSPFWAHVSTNPLLDESGKFIGAVGMFTDITKRKEYEDRLKKSDERYRAFIENSSEGIWRCEIEKPVATNLPVDEQIELFYKYGYLAECNDTMARQYGYDSAKALMGARLADLFVTDDPKNKEFFRAFIESGYRLNEAESHEKDNEGNDRYFLNNFVGFIENGSLVRAWGTQRDITKRKQSEKATAHLAAIVESSDDAIISKDLNGIITSWNKGAENIYGYTPDEVIGKPIMILIPPRLENEERDILERVRRDERIEHYETIRRHKTGTEIDVSISLSPVKDESGIIIGASKIARDISVKKKTEETLRENQMMLAIAMQSSQMGAWEHDIATETVHWSEELEKIFGLEKGSFPGTRTAFYELIHEDDRTRIRAEVGAAIKEKRDYSIEFRFYHADGTVRWMEGRGQAVYSQKGEPVRVYGIGIDITERRRSEEKLRESEERFSKAFNSSPLVITITSLTTGKLIEVNETFVSVTGYTREEAIGRTTAELGLWAKSDDRENELATVQKEEKLRNREYRFRLKDDIEIVGLLSAELLEIRGEPCVLTVIQDITERKKADEKLRENEKQLSLITNSVPALISYIDADHRYQFINREYTNWFGYKKEDILGRKLSDVIGTKAYKTAMPHIEKVFSGKEVSFEQLMPYEKSKPRYIRANYMPDFDNEGKVRGYYALVTDITEQKISEETLRESEERYRGIVSQTVGGIAEVDLNGGFITVNDRFCEIVGYTREELTGKICMQDITHPDDVPRNLEKFKRLVSDGTPFEIEKRYICKDGSVIWVNNSVSAIRDAEGKPRTIVAAVFDVTTRKQAEEAVRESEKRFRSMANNAPMLIWMSDREKLCTYFNQTWLNFTGRTFEQESGNGWTEGIHPDDLEHCLDIYTKSFDARKEFEMEYRLRRHDGEYRWLLDRGTPLFTPGGDFKGYIGTCIDVTERINAQTALILAERKAAEDYQLLLSRIVPVGQTLGTARDLISIYRAVREFVRNSMPCSAFFVSFYDANNNLRTAAYAWGDNGEVDISALPPLKLTGDGGPNSQAVFQKKSVVVNHYMKFMENRPHVILQRNGIDPQTSLVVPMIVMNRVVGTMEVQAYENNAFNREHIIALEMVANLAAVAIENVRLLQIEAEAREIAETANRAKDEFLSVLSHELRTPLNSMLGWVRMLRTGMLDEERSRQAVEVIERNTRLQNSLIEDLLDVSRIISGKMRIDKGEVDLVVIAENSYEAIRPSAESKNIDFNFSSASQSMLVEGDATRLYQVISNLIQNAVKFTPEGGKIDLILKNSGNRAQLTVKDTGIGIESEVLPFIFERFRQADASTRRSFSGLGLGLTIVSNLVELHGGNIKAESDGKSMGATFTVELPVAGKHQDQITAENLSKESDSDLKGARILLVDDDADSIVALQMILEKEKAEVVTVLSADEALEKITEQPFHILISDIGMPEMDGYDLIARIRQLTFEQNAFLPAIALTAYASNEDRRRALSAGFQMHFSKPFDFDELLEAITMLYKEAK